MINNKEKTLVNIGVFSFYIIILFDFITKILLTYSVEVFNRYSLIPKLILNILLLFLVLKSTPFKRNKYVVFFFIMFCLTLLSFFQLYNQYDFKTTYKQVYGLLLYSFPFILVTYFKTLDISKKETLILTLKKHIIIIGVISSALIILGLITNIELFRSYSFSNRFGFNGVFLKTSEASYFYILLIALTAYKARKSKKQLILLILFITTALLIGTKIVWLFLALILFITIWFYYKKITLIAVTISGIIYLVFRKAIDLFLIKLLPNGEILYKENGMFTVLTSTRDLLLEQTIKFSSEHWGIINYLFGGNKYWIYKVEFEIFDLFFNFGLLGLVVYFLFIKNCFYKKVNNDYAKFTLFLVLICACFAGNFFKSFLVFTVFYISFEYLNMKNKLKKQRE